MSMTDDWETVDVDLSTPAHNPATGNAQRTCSVCGETGHDARRHRGGGSATAKTGRTRSPNRKGGPSAHDWTEKVYSKGLQAVAFLFVTQLIRSRNVSDPDDRVADHLSLTTAEATAIAAPFGRFTEGTSFSRKYGARIVDNTDMMDAAFAVIDWQRRVGKFLRETQPRGKAPIVQLVPRDGPVKADEPVQTPPTTEESGEVIDYGIAEAFGGGITGEHFSW